PVRALPSLQLEYEGAGAVQLRFLRLRSRWAAQQVSYRCRPRAARRRPPKAARFLADSREQSYAAALPGCTLDNDSSLTVTVFRFATAELALLPLRDLAVFHDGDAALHFGFTVGPVCFS
ncbi:CO1A1 protein, partial [Eudromia elegans]|nr:CO1A1 protein [Eudromia elegans]